MKRIIYLSLLLTGCNFGMKSIPPKHTHDYKKDPLHKVDLSELSFTNIAKPLSADERLLQIINTNFIGVPMPIQFPKAEQPILGPVLVPGHVTLLWSYPQFYQTWGTTFTVLHSSDLKTWTTLTNVSLPNYSHNAVWIHTNDDFEITTHMFLWDFFKVGVSP